MDKFLLLMKTSIFVRLLKVIYKKTLDLGSILVGNRQQAKTAVLSESTLNVGFKYASFSLTVWHPGILN